MRYDAIINGKDFKVSKKSQIQSAKMPSSLQLGAQVSARKGHYFL